MKVLINLLNFAHMLYLRLIIKKKKLLKKHTHTKYSFLTQLVGKFCDTSRQRGKKSFKIFNCYISKYTS